MTRVEKRILVCVLLNLAVLGLSRELGLSGGVRRDLIVGALGIAICSVTLVFALPLVVRGSFLVRVAGAALCFFPALELLSALDLFSPTRDLFTSRL